MNKAQFFGRKIRLKNQNVCEELRGELCLIGVADNAIQAVKWENRGEYNTECFTATLDDLEFLD